MTYRETHAERQRHYRNGLRVGFAYGLGLAAVIVFGVVGFLVLSGWV